MEVAGLVDSQLAPVCTPQAPGTYLAVVAGRELLVVVGQLAAGSSWGDSRESRAQAQPKWPHRGDHPPEVLEDQQQAGVAECVWLDPFKIEKLGDTFVVGLQELFEYVMFNRRSVDFNEAVATEELNLERQHEYPLDSHGARTPQPAFGAAPGGRGHERP